ncbi:hypothetical protein [Caldanaerobacter sp.]|uniref:hypothetical protein n=1 Tax=Caldanaerobacter sp. TaxID=2930036 RepID=UPI003C75EBD7
MVFKKIVLTGGAKDYIIYDVQRRSAAVAELADAYVWVYDDSVIISILELMNNLATLTNEVDSKYNKKVQAGVLELADRRV